MTTRPTVADRSSCGRTMARGFSLVEILVTMLIISLGLLGLAGLQARAVTSEFESYQRSQAILLAHDMVERIRMNNVNKGAFKSLTALAAGTPYYGTTGVGIATLSCAGATDRAIIDLCAWSDLLRGAAETSAGVSVGAMTDARGCITYDDTTELPGLPDTGVFTVTVVWKGSSPTVAPAVACANGLYGTETLRRAVSVSFRLAKMS